jgi:predicted TIM-barrel fold metal-dependent hydrolase
LRRQMRAVSRRAVKRRLNPFAFLNDELAMSLLDDKITRRAMLLRTAQTSAVAAIGCGVKRASAAEASSQAAGDRIWDMHGHLSGADGTPEESIRRLLKYADRMGIERLIVYMGYPFLADPSPEEVRRQNDQVLRAVGHSGGRAFGFVYLNPKHTEESLKELDRCVRDGPMLGVKLWVAMRCHEQELDPIVERAVELKAPILQHTWLKTTGNLPGESIPEDLAQLAARHPKAAFIAAHVGGQWENGVRAIRATKNVVAEVCGSDPTAGMVEMAVRELGAERVMYGSDFGGRSYASQLAKVYGADLPEGARRLILGGNIRRMLGPILAAKGITP